MTEMEEQRGRRTLTDRWARGVSALIESLVLIVVIAITIPAIGEIAARQQFQSSIASRINALRAQYVDLTRNAPSDTTSQDELQILKKQLFILEEIASGVNLLIVSGSGGAVETLRRLQWLEAGSRDMGIAAIKNPENGVRVSSAFQGDLKASLIWGVLSVATREGVDTALHPVLLRIFSLSARSTDQLLAIAVMGCGAIGAIISGLRANTLVTFRNLSLGLASGFVTFLGIKGGKHFFLVQAAVEQVAFNPYSSAFAGLLAGLFTERAYKLLSSVVDELANKIQKAIEGEPKTVL